MPAVTFISGKIYKNQRSQENFVSSMARTIYVSEQILSQQNKRSLGALPAVRIHHLTSE